MIRLGQMNRLPIVQLEPRGAWLDADEYGQVLLPRRQLPDACQEGDEVTVFVYLDSDGELVATSFKPHAQVGELAGLKVVTANRIGAFLDWGLKKDLFVPVREQAEAMQVGRTYLVRLYLDEQGRVAATSKLDRFLRQDTPPFGVGQAVELLVGAHTPLGFKVVVEGEYPGMLFRNEVFGRLPTGRRIKGFVKQVREDGKLDLTLQAPGLAGRDEASEKILTRLHKQGGFLPVGDKSSPELIHNLFAMSKGQFKRAIGGLYKQGRIRIEEEGIRLVEPEPEA